jgi:lysozyme family protein
MPDSSPSPTDASLRWKMGHQIFLFEREVDRKGNLAIENLPANDGGGAREVAGINMKYDGPEEAKLEQKVRAGDFTEAETEAISYIVHQTDIAHAWCQAAPVEANLRDIVFNRGATGCMRILQKALGVSVDGDFGPITEATEKAAESDVAAFLDDLYSARVWYEHDFIGVRSNLDAGLMNRFAAARDFAKSLLS